MESTVPRLTRRAWLCFVVVLIFKTYCLIFSVWIITIIGSFSSSLEISVSIGVYRTFTGCFKSLTITMMSSWFLNYHKRYCIRFSLNFSYWYSAYLCSALDPNNALIFSTSPLKFLIDDVYDGQLKLPTRPSHHWWPPLPVWAHQLRPWPPLLALDLIVMLEARVIISSLISPPLVTVAG